MECTTHSIKWFIYDSSLQTDQNDRDLACVVSSLVQIMADPHYRTISGFESLVQKEWVAMGYPFTTRSGLVTDSPSNEELVPDGQVRHTSCH